MEMIKVLHESNNDGAACDDRNETDGDTGTSNGYYGWKKKKKEEAIRRTSFTAH